MLPKPSIQKCLCVSIFVYQQDRHHNTCGETYVTVNIEIYSCQALSLRYGSRQSLRAIDTDISSGFAAAGSADGAAVNAGTDCAVPAYTLSTTGLHHVDRTKLSTYNDFSCVCNVSSYLGEESCCCQKYSCNKQCGIIS